MQQITPAAAKLASVLAVRTPHVVIYGPQSNTIGWRVARRLQESMAAPSPQTQWEIGCLRYMATLPQTDDVPLRSPHHCVSVAGLCGGGVPPRPGEVSLAHGGVLFLDDVADFTRAAIQGVIEAMDHGSIVLQRARRTWEFPSRCRMVAAMAGCPCGFHGSDARACICPPSVIERHRERARPLFERSDVTIVDVTPVATREAG